MSLNLCSIVFDAARMFPDAPAILSNGAVLSHSDLRKRVAQMASRLKQQGVRRGDRVALLIANGPNFTVTYYAILALGAIVVPLNIRLKAHEVAFYLSHAEAKVVVFEPLFAEVAKEAIQKGAPWAVGCDVSLVGVVFESDPDLGENLEMDYASTMPDDTAVIFYTSGTTGQPKGAETTHFNLYANAQWVSERSLTDAFGVSENWGPGAVAMAVLPLSHCFGQTCMQNAALLNGAAICYCDPFEASTLVALLEKYRVTVMAAVPRIVRDLMQLPDVSDRDLSAFQYCLVGGATIDPGLMRGFEERFEVEVLEGYGLTETSPVIAFRTPGTPRRAGSVGRPIRGIEMRVVGDDGQELLPGQKGELVVKGHAVMKGYYKHPRATTEAIREGWLRTGDICCIDRDGLVYVVDRKKDVIIRNGYNVYPGEIEKVLLQYPGIREAAVVGVPDPVCGEEIKAVVVGDVDTERLIEFCGKHLASFKCPRIFEYRAELPKGTKGQVLKQRLRDSNEACGSHDG